MIISVTLSKPTGEVEKRLGQPYQKIKIRAVNAAAGASYAVEMFTKTQVFHKKFSESELDDFLKQNSGITFKNVVTRTNSEEITLLTNKKGKTTELRKKLTKAASHETFEGGSTASTSLKILPAKKKNYLLPEGTPVPFLVLLGIMNDEGKSYFQPLRQIPSDKPLSGIY